jgi:anthranilate phosphoribosyltransferase
VLHATGSTDAWVVTGDGPLDEISTTGLTVVRQLKNGAITTLTIDPTSYGLERPAEGALDGGDAQTNLEIMTRLFGGERGAPRDIVLLNSAAALVVSEVATDIADGLERAGEALDSGAVAQKMHEHVNATLT